MADEPEIGPGETGAYVTYLKQLVNYWYPAAQLDDSNDQYDDALGEALRRYQASQGLPATGYCDRATWDALVGGGESQSGDGQSAVGAALAEPVWMDIDAHVQMSGLGVTRWWAGNPAQPARTDAQKIKIAVLRPDGSETYGSEFAFPKLDGTIGPGDYAIIDDEAMATLKTAEGYTMRVIVNPGTDVENSREFKFDVDDQHHWNWTEA
jgi:Putative peptidoglycan binding domain